MAKINLYMQDLQNSISSSSVNTNINSLVNNSDKNIIETCSYTIFSINKPAFAIDIVENNTQIFKPKSSGPTLDLQT